LETAQHDVLARLRLNLSDGELRCPVKGQLAVMRCEERQLETAEAGQTCRCAVYESHPGVRGAELKGIPVMDEPRRERAPRRVNVLVHDRQAAVLGCMRGHGGKASFEQLAGVLGGKKLAERIVRMLVQEGRIERVGKAQYRVAAAT